MSNGVKGIVAALVVALAISLAGVGFLLGRQSGAPGTTAVAAPSPAPLPVLPSPAKPNLDQRLDALEARVSTVGQGKLRNPGAPVQTLSTPTPTAPTISRVEYFRQVDAIVGGQAAIADPRPFATRLLDQGMGGDLDAVLVSTEQAEADLSAVVAPPQCREHQALLLGQLSQAIHLLEQVKSALASGDTADLQTVTENSDQESEDSQRLRSLDRTLRPDAL